MNKNKEITSNELAIKRTKLANERTYLAYMRTGFGVASLAGVFKKWWVFVFGIIMLVISTVQYYIINNHLNNNETLKIPILENLPILYAILGLGILYLQWKK